jgi:hypothetical protein
MSMIWTGKDQRMNGLDLTVGCYPCVAGAGRQYDTCPLRSTYAWKPIENFWFLASVVSERTV